jgi:hypothetical protein
MLKNKTLNVDQNSLLTWIKEKRNNLLNSETISLIKGKEKLLTSFVFFIVVLIAMSLIYGSFAGEEVKTMFSELKPNIPSLPTKNSKSVEFIKGQETEANSSNSGTEVNTKNSLIKAEWQPIDTLLASNDKRREKLFKKLKLNKGEYVIACVFVTCGDCDDIALALNQKPNLSQIIAISTGSVEEANAWKARLGLNFRVESVSSELFDDSGAVILPTLIKVKQLKAIGVSETASVID